MKIDFTNKAIGRQQINEHLSIPSGKYKSYQQPTHKRTYQQQYNRFVGENLDIAQKMNNMRHDGVGPGEVISWYLFDNVEMGGKNSPIDLTLDTGKPLAEVKAGKYDKANHAIVDFKITKDSDPAVKQLQQDINEFHDSYQEITSEGVPGYTAGCITTNGLNYIQNINLNRLSRRSARHLTSSVKLSVHPNGEIRHGGKPVCDFMQEDSLAHLRSFMSGKVQVQVNPDTATLHKIIVRWRQQAMRDYINGKPFALINTTNLQMMHYGKITPSMISLYRISRNQPQARIYLKG